MGRSRQAALEREAEEEKMTPEERRFVEGSFQDRTADEFTEEHLGGPNPRPLEADEDEPPQP